MEEEREILTWELFGTSSRDLAQLVADDWIDFPWSDQEPVVPGRVSVGLGRQ